MSDEDYQPLTASSNAEVVSALNQVSKTCSQLTQENRELRSEVRRLQVTIASDRTQFENKLSSIANTTNQMFELLCRYTSLYNIPSNPPPQPQAIVTQRNQSSTSTSTAAAPSAVRTDQTQHQSFSSIAIGTKRPAEDIAVAQSAPSPQRKKIMIEDGTAYLENIIFDAYYREHFKSGGDWSFATITKDIRFKDSTKFQRCLQLFEVAASDEKKLALEIADLEESEVSDIASSIAKEAMEKLLDLEGKTATVKGRLPQGDKEQDILVSEPELQKLCQASSNILSVEN